MCILRAGVAKLVYAPDSKSGVRQGHVGSSPTSGTIQSATQINGELLTWDTCLYKDINSSFDEDRDLRGVLIRSSLPTGRNLVAVSKY